MKAATFEQDDSMCEAKLGPAPDRAALLAKVRRRGGFGSLSTAKSEEPVRYYLPEERDLGILLEVDPTVLRYASRPHTLRVAAGSRRLTRVPSFVIKKASGIEVCHIQMGDRDDWVKKTITAAYAALGIRYRELVPDDLRTEPRLANSQLLLRCAATHVDETFRFRVAELLEGRRNWTLGELVGALGGRYAEASLLSMASRGVLRLDMGRPISRVTPVALGQSGWVGP